MGRLVLKRKAGEQVIIGGDGGDTTVITIVSTGNEVKLSFESDTDTPVNRAEIAKQKGLKW